MARVTLTFFDVGRLLWRGRILEGVTPGWNGASASSGCMTS